MGVIASVQQYDLNIPVGGSQAIDVAGDRVQFLSAVDPAAKIELRPNFAQGNITLKVGQGMRFAEQVQRWVVFNRGNVDLTGMLMIGTGDFFDQRISGDVTVIDVSRQQTLSNMAFMGYASSPAVAAQFSQLLLFNPVGSGKTVYVQRIQTNSAQATDSLMMSYVTVPVGTDKGALTSKLAGGAGANAHQWTASAAAVPAAFGYINANAEWKSDKPIALKPGNGLLMTSSFQNNGIGWVVETIEDV